jgi:hypothetical protein
MKKLCLVLFSLSVLGSCKKEPSPNTIYVARGQTSQIKPYVPPIIKPISTSGTLSITNSGEKCLGMVLKVGNKLIEVAAGDTRELPIEQGEYTYSTICGFSSNCNALSGTLKNDRKFTIKANEKLMLTLSCF